MKLRTAIHDRQDTEDGYPQLEAIVASTVSELTRGQLFTTDATGLFTAYLASFPEDRRKTYDCRACRMFLNRYGGLVQLDENGKQDSIWDDMIVPYFFVAPVAAMRRLMQKAKVTGVFVSSESVLGQPRTGVWSHMAGYNNGKWPPNGSKEGKLDDWRALSKLASQRAAELHEDFGMLSRAMAEYGLETVREACRVLEADVLYRSEKAIGNAKWFLALKDKTGHLYSPQFANVLWHAVANAPTGYCHVKTNIVSTLMDDIKAGMDFETVSKRWADKMHPLQYQRPQAAPKAGNIAQAEKLVDQMGLRLERRYATLDDIEAVWWNPKMAEKPKSGLFDHLKAKSPRLDLPPKTMTMEKFLPTVIYGNHTIEFMVTGLAQNFCALVTEVNRGSPRLFHWDHPVSWYVYSGGSMPATWGMRPGWAKVNVVTECPAHWGGAKFDNFEPARLFILEGCHDTRKPGAGLFPEIIRSELREVKSVIEAYSNSAGIVGQGSACGIAFGKSAKIPIVLRVDGQEITIDRWE